MWLLFIALLFPNTFAYLSKNFGTFYISEDESTTLSLNDYFSPNENYFWITNTNSTSNDILLSQNSSIQLISYTNHETSEDFYTNTYSYENFPTISLYNRSLLVWYRGKCIVLYLMKEDAYALEKLWTLEIGDSNCKGEITQVRAMQGKFGSIIILFRCYRKAYWENEFYKIDLTHNNQIEKFTKLALWEAKYLNDPNISIQEFDSFLSIFGRFKSEEQIIFIYKIDYTGLKLIQTIENYNESNQLNKYSFNIAEVQFLGSYMELLDTHLGLIFYSFNGFENKFEFKLFCNLTQYEPLYTFTSKTASSKASIYAIGAEKGAVILLIKNDFFDIRGWIDIHDAIGYYLPVKSLSIDFESGLLYVNGIHESFLLFIILNQNRDIKLISSISLRELIGKTFNAYGLWTSMKLAFSHFYIRSDNDGIRLFSLDLKSWRLTIRGNHSFYAEITGKTSNKSKNHTKNPLKVISIPLDSKEILKVKNYQEMNSAPIEINSQSSFFLTLIYPNLYFSGPNLTFEITDIDFPSEFSVHIENPKPNNEATLVINLPKEFDIVKVNLNTIGALSNEGLLIIDIESNSYETLKGPLKITNFILERTFIITIELEENGAQWILLYDASDTYFPLSLIERYKLDTNCEILKISDPNYSISFFVCANSESIYLYQHISSKINFILKISKDQLRSFGVSFIIDLDVLWCYSTIYLTTIFYIIDRYNGLLAIECSLASLSCKAIDNLFPIEPSNIKLIAAASESIVYVICNDGIIRVYDKNLYHLKSLSTHTKGNIIAAYSVKHILLIQIGNCIEIFDGFQSAHSSLQYTFDVEENCSIIWTGSHYSTSLIIPFISVLCNGTSVRLYEYKCNFDNDRCFNPFKLELSINDDAIIKKNEYIGKITLLTHNSAYESSTDVYFKLNVCKNDIWVNSEKIPHRIDVDYSIGKNISLEGAFYGNNIQIAFELDNRTNNDSQVLPINLYQAYQKSDSLSHNDAKFYDHIFIEEMGKFVITSNKGIMILDYGKNSLNFESLLELENLFPYKIINCRPLSNLGLRENFLLIASFCSYQMFITELWNEKLKVINSAHNALLIVEYNVLLKSASKVAYTYLGHEKYILKSIRTSKFRFEVFLTKINPYNLFLKTNSIYWYKGIWNQKKLVINFEKEINNILLGINDFFVNSIDVAIFEANQIVLYAIDVTFGLRVILIDENSQISIKENIPHFGLNNFSSLCKSQDTLYIMSSLHSLFKYSITKRNSLVFDDVFHSDFTPKIQDDFIESVWCTPQYVFKSTMIKNEAFLEIWKNSWSSRIKIGKYSEFKFNLNIQYIGGNTISLIKDQSFSIEIWNLIDPFLEIPPTSKENYIKIKNALGRDEIDIKIYAYNEFKRADLSNIRLKLSDITEIHSHNLTWLLMGLLICIVLIVFGFTIVYCIKKKMSNKADDIEEGLVLEEFKRNK